MGGKHDDFSSPGRMYELTPEQVDLGRLAVARMAIDGADCLELLYMLGLVDPKEPPPKCKGRGGRG